MREVINLNRQRLLNQGVTSWTSRLGHVSFVECGSSAVECRTSNQVSPGSNPPLLPFRRLGIFVLSIVVPVDAVV